MVSADGKDELFDGAEIRKNMVKRGGNIVN
jgi:hypothetical protein